ncbi:flagellin N-terminal helical domain-containing protein [Acetoanaerobium noterae]|uniref:flagellin N-terminal helical domain-containing protein n=1 Tax=Acetoanaerobium noterae TaxID=745369 RepID=UPI001A9A3C52|nr:flagellin [Acetoanaerobium noterae]
MDILKINHNLNAINAHNKMKINNNYYSKTMNRLSSGLKINSAADDSAGLSISQKMKTQIRGLYLVERNIRDGIGLLQTAEGGLSEIENPSLQRIRELAVQASNGTLTLEDRKHIQKEINELKDGIDDIANNTEFNGIKVLSPPTENIPVIGTADIIFIVDNTGSMGPIQTQVANNIVSFTQSMLSKGITELRIGVLSYYDNTYTKHEFSGEKWTSDPLAVAQVLNEISITNNGSYENNMQAIGEVVNHYDFNENTPGKNNKHIILITNEVGDDNANIDVAKTLLQDEGIQLHGIFNDSFTDLKSVVQSTGGKLIDLSSLDWGANLSSVIGTHIGESSTIIQHDKMQTIYLQVGPNFKQNFKIELFDARTHKLGISDLSVETIEDAQIAISTLDKVIELVSSRRSRFGAYQNALEHLNNSVSIYKENIVAAESRIGDADVSEEMMNLTKFRILLETSQHTLVKSNEVMNQILSFLNE